MKTIEEVIAKIKSLQGSIDDFFGAMKSDLLQFLPYDSAKEFLKSEATKEKWDAVYKELTEENVKSRMRDYLPFAWEKANNCRGISAGRSMDHMKAYLWLLEDDDLLNFVENDYHWYGKPQLKRISEKYGFDWKAHHDGMVGNDESSQSENDLSGV